jgi:hypothetical protein
VTSRVRSLRIARARAATCACIFLLSGCAQGYISPVVTRFDPESVFVKGLGFPRHRDDGGGSGSEIVTAQPRAEGYWFGTLVTPDGDVSMDRVFAAVKDFVAGATRDERVNATELGKTTLLIDYKYGRNTGRVFLALFPIDEGRMLRYSMYVFEGRLDWSLP